MNTTTITPNKTAKKYLDIINSGTIEEGQIISLRSWMNKRENKEYLPLIWAALDGRELDLNPAQNKKGFDFLMDCWKTPTGAERKNNPFGYREQEILTNFRDFTLKSFYNTGNSYVDNWLPLYSCNSNDGNGFEYYYNGKVNIVG